MGDYPGFYEYARIVEEIEKRDGHSFFDPDPVEVEDQFEKNLIAGIPYIDLREC